MYTTSMAISDTSGFIFAQWITYRTTYLRFQSIANWRNYPSLSSKCDCFLSKERLTCKISPSQDKVSHCVLI